MIKETKTRHFFYLLFALCLIYNYQNILKLGPRSTHQWRQADALSFSLNYLNDGMKLFEPKIHAQYALNGKSVGEFPIVYYINAFVWKVTGINYITPRLLILLLSFMGLFFLFKAGKLLLEDGFWSLLLPIVLFTSPVFVFYANNFLVNIPALSFLFGAWYFLLKFRLNFTRKYLIISVLFFAISLLLRSTMIMGYLPVLLIYFLELFGILKPLVSRKKVADFLLLFIPFFVLYAWYLFAKNYNRVNHSVDFLITFRPIWVAENIGDIWVKFYNELLPNFHFGFVGTLILAAFLFLLAAIKKMPPHFTLFLVLIALEIVSYFFLWFLQFDVHDYYTLDFFIFFPPVILGFFAFQKKYSPDIFESKKFKGLTVFFAIVFIVGCSIKSRAKYNSKDFIFNKRLILSKTDNDYWNWFHWQYKDRGLALETIKPYLKSVGIKKEDLVISFPDQSTSISLFFMDQKGFTNLYNYDKSFGEKTSIYKSRGAKYLIISEPNLLQDSTLLPFLTHKIGEYKNVQIFELKN